MSGLAIVGGGPAGLAAARAYREAGGDGPVTMLTAEAEAPYVRPLLSKELLRGETDEAALEDEAWFADNDVELRREAEVEALDPDAAPPAPGRRRDARVRRVRARHRLRARCGSRSRAPTIPAILNLRSLHDARGPARPRRARRAARS